MLLCNIKLDNMMFSDNVLLNLKVYNMISDKIMLSDSMLLFFSWKLSSLSDLSFFN
jgi:hypothetical protein